LNPLDNPFPEQIRALESIRQGLNGDAYFVEAIFNPFNVAEKLSSPAEVRRLRDENPPALLNALDVITQSQNQPSQTIHFHRRTRNPFGCGERQLQRTFSGRLRSFQCAL
jgi:hypothetical protein